MSISIITNNCINNNLIKKLFNIINNQTHQDIKEWIIFDKYSILDKDIFKLDKSIFDIKIFTNEKDYVNKNDYMLYMDSNIFYCNTFIEICLKKMNNSNLKKIQTNYVYVYDFITMCVYKYFNKMDILISNNNISNTEESINTDILLIFFNYGDMLNRELLVSSGITNNKIFNKMEYQLMDYLVEPIVLEEYKKIYVDNDNNIENYNNNNIIYLTGGFGISWDPENTNLGGSEQAIVELSKKWINNKVIVYGNFNTEKTINNVTYKKWFNFPFNNNFNNVIIWRKNGMLILLNYKFNCKNVILDFHDNFSYTINDLSCIQLSKIFDKVNHFNFKSNYHKKCFIEFLLDKKVNLSDDKKFNIIPNGVRISEFSVNAKKYIRNPYRFCYCSSYDRGLHIIINKIWPKILEHQPLAELHIYYGMDYIYDEKFKMNMQYLLGNKGIMDHGRQPMDIIIMEKYLSTFHIYLTDAISEIDCISIKESIVAGCIPIISNDNVFEERDGLKFNLKNNILSDDELFNNITNDIIKIMDDIKYLDTLRDKLYKSNTIKSWEYVSEKWLKLMND